MRILYVDCDSLRPDHLGCYGYHRNTSPNVDALAEEGMQFTNYYTSDAPCLPSRTALFTGRFGIHTGVVNHGGVAADVRPQGPDRQDNNAGEFRTWTRTLRDAGHRTALISPFPQRHAAWPVLDGFDEWYDTGGGGSERAEVVSPYAERWLDDHAAESDWYLHVNFWDPHTDYDTPTEYGNPFADEPAPKWPTEDAIRDHYESYGPHSAHDLHHGYLTGDGAPSDLTRVPDEIASREDFVRWIDGYDVGIRYMDDHIGTLLETLEAAGVLDETLVIVSADHGENQGELNVYGDHQTADDMTCRVPLIVRGPGIATGVDDGLHYNVDLAPTISELVGADPAPRWDGESFARTLTEGADGADEGEDAGRDFLIVGQGTWSCQRGVRWDDWLLVRTYHDGYREFDPVMLFDLAADPHETENLADERPDVANEGVALLERWERERMMETALDRAGGTADSPRALVDPLLAVIHEGGPYYLRGNRDSYVNRLRETGREEAAEKIERDDGIVSQVPDR